MKVDFGFFQAIGNILSGKSHEEAYARGIFKEAAGEIAKVTGGNEKHIEAALCDPNLHDSDLLKDVLRIEFEAEKRDASTINSKISVFVMDKKDPGKIKEITMEYQESWDNLPDQVRSDFIKKGGNKHAYIMFGGNNGDKDSKTVTEPHKATPVDHLGQGNEDTRQLENLLDDVFTRAYTEKHRTLQGQLQKAADNIYDYYSQCLTGSTSAETIDRTAHYKKYPAVQFSHGNYEVFIMSSPNYGSTRNSEGIFYIRIARKDKKPFGPNERNVIDNFPVSLVMKSSKGLQISETTPVTLQTVKDTNNSATMIKFSFDIENGQASILHGTEDVDDRTRIIKLPVRSPLMNTV